MEGWTHENEVQQGEGMPGVRPADEKGRILCSTGGSEIRPKKMYLAAKELGVTTSDLTDDTYYRQDEDFISRIKPENKKDPSRKSTGAFRTVPPQGFEPWTR